MFASRVSHHFLVRGFLKECSHTLTTLHPCFLRLALTTRSLFLLFPIFLSQYIRLLFGSLKCILQPCQKQLSKKTAIILPRQTASGTPSMSLGCSSNFSRTLGSSSSRKAFSNMVFFERMDAIIRDRFSFGKTSIPFPSPFCVFHF